MKTSQVRDLDGMLAVEYPNRSSFDVRTRCALKCILRAHLRELRELSGCNVGSGVCVGSLELG